jgi:DNA-binding MarR family transcriptional regulator
MNLDKQLADTEYIKKQNWGKLLNLSKRQFDEWAMRRLNSHGYSDFKMAYMPVLMNIQSGGTNNNELAGHARVTKQAMSKVARELQEMGYIKSKPSPEDKRSTIFTLTDRGKKLVIQARLSVQELMDTYRKEFGKEEFERTLKMMFRIIEYTDQKLINKNE